MERFDLLPVDGGDPIHVPPGETVLGRGPFLGLTDRRVSRTHCLLLCEDGHLQLKPTHLNPCFVQSSLNGEPRPLQRGLWAPLRPGALFSLLPGLFIYRVEAVGGDAATPRNSQMLEGEQEEQEEEEQEEEQEEEEHQEEEQEEQQEEEEEQEEQQEEQEEEVRGVTEALGGCRRRVLPAWMMAAVSSSKSLSLSLTVQPAVKKLKPSTWGDPQAPPPPPDSSPQQEPRRKRRRREEEQTTPTQPVEVRPAGAHPSDGCHGAAVSMAGTNGACRTGTTSGHKPPTNQSSATGAASQLKARTPCQYGRACYRKNPLHFQECSHPGDPDYQEEEEEEEEEGEEEERPECPFGSDCYRKNPLHRKEYTHTQRAPSLANRDVATKCRHDDEDEYDDSFIDDDSEDAGDDSDYVPPADSDDGEQEDVRRLQQEAQSFLRRRR